MYRSGIQLRRPLIAALVWACAVPWVGCTALLSTPAPTDVKQFLTAVETSPDSVTLEIVQVRLPADDQQFSDQLWQTVDEQVLDVEVRRRLARNGFRAGVLGGTLPDALARKLKLEGEHIARSNEQVIDRQSANPTVVRRVLQLNRHESAMIQASDLHGSLNVLVADKSGLQGHSYQQAQASYALRAASVPGQRIALELAPEVQHGELKNRYAGSDLGTFVVTPSREREVYEDLGIKADLAPGEFLLVGCLDDVPGSLGHVFHSQNNSGPTEHKLVLVRVVEYPRSEILAQVD